MELVVASCFVEPALVGSWRGVGERREFLDLQKLDCKNSSYIMLNREYWLKVQRLNSVKLFSDNFKYKCN